MSLHSRIVYKSQQIQETTPIVPQQHARKVPIIPYSIKILTYYFTVDPALNRMVG